MQHCHAECGAPLRLIVKKEKALMHYDEYEISMAREISNCRRVIKGLKSDLQKKEKQYGITTDNVLGMQDESLSADTRHIMDRWRNDHRQLIEWERRLRDYEDALADIKRPRE